MFRISSFALPHLLPRRLPQTVWALAMTLAAGAFAQSRGEAALRVFLDCTRGCDTTFLKRDINFVNFVRDRGDADVHILVTRTSSAAGRRYQLNYHGQNRFAQLDQELHYDSASRDTDDDRRRGLARLIRLGLVPYVLQTPAGVRLQVAYEPPPDAAPASVPDDPWNAWVFSSRVGGNLNRHDRRDDREVSGSFSAGRTTETWRMGVGLNHRAQRREFEFDDGTTLDDVSRQSSIWSFAIKSLGEHWGVGAGANTRRSTFLNLERGYRVAGALEYNLYPYAESSLRSLTFGYYAGHMRLSYETQTIFGLVQESRSNQGLYVDYAVKQPWGQAALVLKTAQYIDDPSLHRVTLSGNLDYRILRGLSVNLWAEAALVRDQIYLPAAGTTDEDVLLGRRALDTGFERRLGVSLRYQFGSIFTNVVNSRLRGSGFTGIF